MKKEVAMQKQTVSKIIDAAIPLFAMKGFAAVSVKELAEAADVNIALISYYFGGKENLYSVVLEKQFAIIAEITDTASKEEISTVDKLKYFAKSMVKAHKQYPYISQLVYGEIINPTACFETVKKGMKSQHRFFSDCISSAIATGQFRSDLKPEYAVLSLISIINFYFFTWHLAREFLPESDDQIEIYASQAIQIYLNGVLNH